MTAPAESVVTRTIHPQMPLGGQTYRGLALAAVWIPMVGFAVAVWLVWGRGIGVLELALLTCMYFVSVIGIEVGYHRHFSHAAFSAPKAVRLALGIAGSMAVQGPVIFWAAIHRRHHKFSDQPGDPHSPHMYGEGVGAIVRGLLHAHVGWLFRPEHTDWRVYVPDLLRDRTVFSINRWYPCWILIGFGIPTLVGAAIHRSWTGAAQGFLWGGLVRIFLVHHGTWSVNSICHWIGSRSFPTRDRSTNSFWLALISMGGSWHHNHHAFPNSATNSLRWWEVDMSWWFIYCLYAVGLASNLRRPGPVQLARSIPPESLPQLQQEEKDEDSN
jgi:stearoyl-CoA desaturase (delta-9 desaturase)